MAFFRQFPRTLYTVDDTLINIPDIFRRVAPNSIINSMMAMSSYDIQDGQKPEHLSHDVYGTVDYYWVILIVNNIVDPYHDWPKSSEDLLDFTKQRYGAENIHKIHHYVDGTNADIRVDFEPKLKKYWSTRTEIRRIKAIFQHSKYLASCFVGA